MAESASLQWHSAVEGEAEDPPPNHSWSGTRGREEIINMSFFSRKREPQQQPSGPEPQELKDMVDAMFGPGGRPVLIAITKDDEPGRTVWMAFGSWEDPAAFAARLSAPGCPARAVDWDTDMPGVLQTVTQILRDTRQERILLGVSDYSEWGRWELPLEPPPVPQLGGGPFGRLPESQSAEQMADVRSEGTDTPVAGSGPSAAGDDFNEGDRVMLAKPFWGEPDPDTGTLLKDWSGPDRGDPPTYPAGSKGTIIYPDPASPELIKQMKANSEYIVAMDDGRELYAGGPFPGVEGAALERISGQYQVARQDGKIYVRPRFGDGDRVRLTQSFTSEKTGKHYEAGWKGAICPLSVTMAECWRTGYYPVSLDDDPFGGDRGMINVPAEVLELVPR
jgi:hypothetical protein